MTMQRASKYLNTKLGHLSCQQSKKQNMQNQPGKRKKTNRLIISNQLFVLIRWQWVLTQNVS